MKFRKIISVILALMVILSSVPVSSSLIANAEESAEAFKGVDVSRWNGNIDWATMKKRGIDFVIMRCYSYGTDKKFYEYYDGASEAGFDIGAYVFMYAETKKEAQKEAKDVLATLDGRGLTYPLFVDIEYEKLKNLKRDFLTDIVITELEIFKKAGYEVGTYCSKNFQATYLDMERLSDYYVWTAKWSLYSTENDGKKYYYKNMDAYDASRPVGDLWQFSNGGYGPYYGTESHYLDLDYCYVDFNNKVDSTVSKNPEDYTAPERNLSYNSSSMMRGNDVAWVQAVLYQLGYIASVDGVYSPATKTAVQKFQKNCGLPETGTADPDTVDKLSDVYSHRDFSAKVKINPTNSSSTVTVGTFPYGTAVAPKEKLAVSKEGFILGGWALYRSSDKKYLCTDGVWRTSKEISKGGYVKKVFLPDKKVSIVSGFLSTPDIKSDTFTFVAQWDTQPAPKYTVYQNGYAYSIYYGTLSYEEAEKFCISKGGALADFINTEELSVLSVLKKGEKFLTGAVKTEDTYKWADGSEISFPVSGENGNYLAVSLSSISEPYSLISVSDSGDTDGFIMKSRCPHDSVITENFTDTLCDKNGYSGDKVCADCREVLKKGNTVHSKGHTYSGYTVIKSATCKKTGTKEKTCIVCGYTASEKIPKTNKHTFKTAVIKKATSSASGKAANKCKICGYTGKEYSVPRIKSVRPSKTSFVYTGKSIKPSVTVKDKSGKVLIKGTDYTVSYEKNKYVGKATVTVKFKGKYEGVIRRTFKILPVATAFSSASSKNRAVTVKWKKISKQSTGYLIEYGTSKSFSKNVKSIRIKSPKTVTKTVSGLKKGKTMYFRIRTYKTSGGKNYYSKWSKVKKATVK